jgi:F0F1-type ATP synthase delta subunit
MAALTGLAARLSGKKVTLTQVLAPELLGGVRLRLGNVLYDGSVLASLQQMQDRLLQASI